MYRAWFEANLREFRLAGDGRAHALCPIHADTSPSLSINLKTGWCQCFGACGTSWPADVFAGLAGLPTEGLPTRQAPSQQGRPSRTSRVPVAEWVYTDAAGAPLFKVIRYPNRKDGSKDILQARYEDGRFSFGMKDKRGRRVPGILYRLPQLHAAPPDAPVWFVEGEKDADNGASLGLLTTTTPGGSNGFRKTDPRCFEVLRGRRVYVIPDNDAPGLKYAREAALAFTRAGSDVRVLPPLPVRAGEGGDLSDWLAAGGSRDQLLALAEHAQAPEQGDAPPENDEDAFPFEPRPGIRAFDFLRTDLGNGELFVALWEDSVRFCHPLRSWLIWDGVRWQYDRRGLASRLASLTARKRLDDAKYSPEPKDETKFALATESGRLRREMLEAAKVQQEIVVLPEELDANPWILGCANGTIDLVTGTLREACREDLITKAIPVAFNKDATCPRWEAFLDRVLCTDGLTPDIELISYVQRAVGYALTGAVREHAFFVCHGRGANGKSTLLETLAALLGPDYTYRLPVEVLLEQHRQSGNASPELAELKGRRLAFTSEADQNRSLAEGLVKQLTGADTITARRLYQDTVTFRPSHKLWLTTNHRPDVRGTDDGIWRRIHLIPFNVQIPEHERDASLGDKLATELPGILNWALRGCQEWQRRGLLPPRAVRAATDQYREDSDIMAEFFADRCVLAPTAKAKGSLLYAAYSSWATVRGEKPMSSKRLAATLKDRGFGYFRGNGSWWTGIGIVEETGRDEADPGLFEAQPSPEPASSGLRMEEAIF